MKNSTKVYHVKDKDSITKTIDSFQSLKKGNFKEELPLNGIMAIKILNLFSAKHKTLH